MPFLLRYRLIFCSSTDFLFTRKALSLASYRFRRTRARPIASILLPLMFLTSRPHFVILSLNCLRLNRESVLQYTSKRSREFIRGNEAKLLPHNAHYIAKRLLFLNVQPFDGRFLHLPFMSRISVSLSRCCSWRRCHSGQARSGQARSGIHIVK